MKSPISMPPGGPVLRPILLHFLAALAVLAAGCSSTTKPQVVPPLKRIDLMPAVDTIQVGQLRTFTAVAVDTNDAAVVVPFTWSTSNPLIASVNGSGVVRGEGEGAVLITAAAGDKVDTAVVAVFPDTGWIAQTSNASEDLYGVFFRPDGRTGWAVGGAGVVLSTVDAGVVWSRRIVSTFSLNAVWFWSDDDGCAVGNSGAIFRSVRALDGTLNWVPADSVFASQNLFDVTFAKSDSLIGWAVGQNGVILRTTNGGRRWEKKFIPGAQTFRGVSFAGTKDGWAVGDNGIIAGTHDRGLTWFVVQPSVTTQSLTSVWRASTLRAIAVGAQGVSPRTWVPPGDSISWKLENAGAAFQLVGIAFGDSVAFAAGATAGAGALLRSDDFGVTWTAQTARSQFGLNDVFFVDRQRGWAVGNNGTIRHTARGGGR